MVKTTISKYVWRTDEFLCLQNKDKSYSIPSHIFWYFVLGCIIGVYLAIPLWIGVFTGWGNAVAYWIILGLITALFLLWFFTDGEV